MGLTSVSAVSDAATAGRIHSCTFRKVPSQATVANWWVDYSMASGNPVPNYYASNPQEAATLSSFKGIFHGDDKAPASKHLINWGLMTPTAGLVGQYTMCDYLLYYPFVDGDSADQQFLDNSTAQISRYVDGAGVQAMAVAVAPTLGGGSFNFTYINQAGVERTSPTQFFSTAAAGISSIVTSQPAVANMNGGPFLRLAPGDTGVRAITSWTNLASTGGLLSLVLVRPLINLAIREINTAVEVPLINNRPGAPQIYDDAYLNLIGMCSGSVAAGQLTGYADFVWSE